MSAFSQSRRGAPLIMLAVLVSAWVGARAMLWESPFAIGEALTQAADVLMAEAPSDSAAPSATADLAKAPLQFPQQAAPARWLAASSAPINQSLTYESIFSARPGVAAGHQMLLMAAMGQLPLPRAVEEAWNTPLTPFASWQDAPGAGWSLPRDTKPVANSDRWSLDAWTYWREGSNSSLISQGRVPVYGASQAGAVLQYRVAPRSGHDPRAYLRGYKALVGNGESEAAFGLSARPFTNVPLRLHAEARLTEGRADTVIRRAAFATTELPTVQLPMGAQAEIYAQGGYVTGSASTAFVDGQAQVTRQIANFDLAKTGSARVSLGGGAWAGAQDNVHRVDLGPTARVDLTIGDVPARLSVDWRERIVGDAAPSSGIAATLSTRF